MRGKIEKSILIVGDFNITVPPTNSTSRQISVKIQNKQPD